MKTKNGDTTKTYENLQQEIAERKRAEDRIWLQSQILEIMAEGVNLVRASDSIIVYANPGIEQMFGYEPGELVGIHVSVLNAPTEKNPQEMAAEISKVLTEKCEWRGEVYNVRKDGTKFWCSVNIKAFQHPEHGKVWISVHKDITERKRAEEALKAAIAKAEDEKNKSNAIIDAIGDGIIIQDTDYKILYQNKIQNDLYGNRVGEYCYKTYEGRDAICEDCPIELSFKDGKIHKAERKVPTGNGILYSELTGSSLKDSTGKIIAGIKVVRDITELRRNEKALQESETRYRTLFETMLKGVVYQDAEGKIISANPAAERMLGLTIDQMQGRTSTDPGWKAIHEGGKDFPGETHPSMVALRTGKEVNNVVMGVFNPQEEKYCWINIHGVPQFRPGENKPYQVYTIFDDITERKRAEEVLREGERFLESVFASIQDGIGIIDKDMNILRVNPTAEGWYPYAAPFVGKKCYEAYHRRSERCEGCPAWKTLKTGESAYKIVPKHGPGGKEVGWLEIYSFPMIDTTTGEMRGAIEYVRDITERKRVEKEKDRLLKAIDSSTDGITIADEKDLYIYVNAAYATIFGYSQEEFIGETWRKITPPELIAPTEKELSRTMHNKDIGTFRGEFPGLRKDGTIIPTEVQGTALRDENGSYQGHICVVRDITERKRVEEALQKSNHQQNAILNNIPDLAWLKDNESRFIAVNEPFAKACGMSPEELVRKTDLDIWPQELAERYKADDREVMETGRRKQVEEPLVNKKGEKTWIETIKTPIYNERGEVIGTTGIARDITERKRMEEALMLFSEAVENAPDSVQIADLNGHIIYSNKATEEIYGFSSEEFKGKHVDELNADPKIASKVILPAIKESGRWVGELTVKHKDGRTFPIWLKTSMIKNSKGEPIAMMGIIRDITERKRAEEAIKKYAKELEDSNRMKELFIDIMHHDLINPLTAASGFIELLKEDEIKSRKRAYLETIERNLVKALELMESATRLSKLESSKSIKLTNMDLEKVINEVTGNMSPLAADAGMEIENKINMSMPVKANKIIEEVFANIISNAVKYASSGKRIVLDCKESEGCWNIRFTDSGEGIEDRDKTVIFDRFHRIEKKGVKGSGLGLAIASKIMELHNGRIWVEDNPEGGAVFVVEIPKHLK